MNLTLLAFVFKSLCRETSTPESTVEHDGKENVAPYSNSGDHSEKSIKESRQNLDASFSGSTLFTGNTWEEYFTSTVGKSGKAEENLHGAALSAADLEGDKYSAIALLDDDLEEEKWSERTAVITALDHQVR